MNADFATPEDLQADALIAEIRSHTAAEIARLRADGAREAEAVRERARDKARRQQRRAVAELRTLAQQQLQRVQAELETAARRHAADEARARLAAVEPRLRQALAGRWADHTTRGRWIDALLALAHNRLGAGPWLLRHPPAADEALAARLQGRLRSLGRDGDVLRADAALADGLVVDADGARVDGCADALLADRSTVQAIVLARLERVPSR